MGRRAEKPIALRFASSLALLALAIVGMLLATASPSPAASGTWERAWGKDVVSGGSVLFEICTVASSCKQGTSGTGLGGEMSPTGIDVDASGRVYIAEYISHRAQRFNAQGTWARAWGKDVIAAGGTGFEICTAILSCKVGTAGGLGGEMYGSTDIEADGAGHVFVVEQTNNRVERFDLDGNFQRVWGKDVVHAGGTAFEVCTSAGDCAAGAPGGLGGEMSLPVGIGVDGAGNVYVADRFNHRIQKFDADGNFQRTWGKDVVAGGGTGFEVCTAPGSCKAGVIGGAGGELHYPGGIATDSAGNVYIGDTFNHRIQKFDSQGNFQRAWGKDVAAGGGLGFEVCAAAASCQAGTAGGLGGEIFYSDDVEVDSAGKVYVADSSNHRIQRFDPLGNFERAWGKDVSSAGGTGFEICTDPAACKSGVTGGLGGEFAFPSGVTIGAGDSLLVADLDNHRVQKFSDPVPRRCRGSRATITGTPGADTLTGTPGRDVVVALGGRDRVNTRGGSDLICAGGGADRVRAGGGKDRAYGERGPDLLAGGGGRDRLVGGPGRDTLRGGGGRGDRCLGGPGRDRASGCELTKSIP